MTKTSYKIKILFIYIISVIFVSFIVYKLLSSFHETNVENISISHFKTKALEREDFLKNFFSPYFSTIKAIQKSNSFTQYLSNKKSKEDIEEYFLNIKRSLPCITQVRYIDKNGFEKIRIEGTPISLAKENAVSKIVPVNNLQNKSTRDYFKKFIQLEKNEIGLSKIDLNMEHGKISIPKQPTLRLGMTALDENKNIKGVIVINICLRSFFKLVNETMLYYVHLMDENGIYLNHHDKRYGLLGDNMNYSIQDEFPLQAKYILNNDEYFGEDFYSKKLSTFKNGQNIKILLELKFEEKLQQRKENLNRFIFLAVLFALILIPALIYISKLPDLLNLKLKKKEEIENKNIFINTLLKSIPIPMFYKDINGVYFDVNKAYCEIFGFEYDEIVGKTVYDVADKETANIYKKQDDELIKNNNKETQVYEYVVKNFKIGKLYNVIFHKNVFFDINNKPLGIIGAVVDITQITEIKNELEELNKNLEERVIKEVEKNIKQEVQLFESAKLASLGEMIGNIIHQWKQPLNLISLKASLIQLKAQHKKEMKNEYIEKEMQYIADAIQRLSEVTVTFRDFLKEKKEIRSVVLQDIVDKSLVISGTILNDKGIELIKQIDYEQPIKIDIVANELMEVIINIINNAIDVLEERNIIEAWVKISLYSKYDKIFISIEDNAGGIPQDILEHIFDEYFTTKDEDRGTGLGLYMSQKIVNESLNGNIEIENTQNGAKFTLILPKR